MADTFNVSIRKATDTTFGTIITGLRSPVYTFSNLAPGTDYVYEVSVTSSNGLTSPFTTGTFSTLASITPSPTPTPTPPVIPSPTPVPTPTPTPTPVTPTPAPLPTPTPMPIPATPQNFTVSNITANSAQASWTASNLTDTYSVEIKLAADPAYTILATGLTQTNYTFSNLAASTVYNAAVVAVGTDTLTSNPAQAQFLTPAVSVPTPTPVPNPAPTGTPVQIGVYVGNVGDAGFNAQWDGFVSVMGRTPAIVTNYMDQTYAPTDATFGWPQQATYLAGIMKGDSRTANAIPQFGWPFGWTNNGTNVNLFSSVSGGTLDSTIQQTLANWKAGGIISLYIRPSWEFNLPNNYAVTAANLSSFIAAWRHFYTVVHTYANANGMNIKVIWCPNVGNNQNSTSLTVAQQYPGDGYVDVYGIDTYGAPVDSGHLPGATTTDATQYLVTTMINMAAASGKSISFGEVGGIDQQFAQAMVTTLTNRNSAVGIEFFAFWDINDSSGNLSWTNASDNQTALANIWKSGFGPNGSVVNGGGGVIPTPAPTPTPTGPDHVVLCIMENTSYATIVGNGAAPYINGLFSRGCLLTNYFAVSHPSEPNYFALFSGSTQGVTDDGNYYFPNTTTICGQLRSAGKTFVGYPELSGGSEASPQKHNPWESFGDSQNAETPFSSFPANYANLPSFAWVSPNLMNDMHDGTIQQGDAWLQANLGGYINWCQNNNSIFILVWDEDDSSGNNQVVALVIGQNIANGATDNTAVNHYSMLRLIEDFLGLSHLANAANATPIQLTAVTPVSGPSVVPSPTPAPSSSAIVITPGNGSFSDASGNVYTLDSAGNAIENGQPIPGGAGTSQMEYANNTVYAQDASNGTWFIWNGSAFIPASAPPIGSPTPAPITTATPAKLLFEDTFQTLSLSDYVTGTVGTWQLGGRSYQPSGASTGPTFEPNPFNPATPFYMAAASSGGLILTTDNTPAQYAAACNNLPYVGVWMSTRGTKFFQWGYYEASIKQGNIEGVAGTFWLLAENGAWPPEIDIAEGGQEPAGFEVSHNVYDVATKTGLSNWYLFSNTSSSNNTLAGSLTDLTQFHTFGADVQPDFITFYFDNIVTERIATPSGYATSGGFYIVLSMGVPGPSSYFGNPNNALLPCHNYVQWVRVWDKKPS